MSPVTSVDQHDRPRRATLDRVSGTHTAEPAAGPRGRPPTIRTGQSRAPKWGGRIPRQRDLRGTDGPAGPQPPAGSRPLRDNDPVSVDGHRLISRLGSGGMADVFYALAPDGAPVAVKLLRPVGGAQEACQREHHLASTVDSCCTAPVLGHGMSTAGAYLVTAHLPGHRCGSTLVGGPTPANQLWSLGAALARTLAAIHARDIVHCDVKPSNLSSPGDACSRDLPPASTHSPAAANRNGSCESSAPNQTCTAYPRASTT